MSDTPKQCSDVDVLISACCAGEASASSELRSILRPGIRFLLERRGANPALADGILAQILREVAGGTVIRQSELLRRTRDAVLEAATSSGEIRSAPTSPRLTIPDRDREMLRCYYLKGEPLESICRRLSVSPAAFEAARQRLRGSLPHRVSTSPEDSRDETQ